MTAVELRLTLLQEIATILDDETLVKKALTSIRRLKQSTTKAVSEDEDREPTKEEMLEDLKQSFLELKAAREGRIHLRDAKELLNE